MTFYSNRDGSYQVWLMRSDGADLRMLTKATEGVDFPTVSPDGTRLAMGTSAGGVVMARVEENWFTPGKAPEPIAYGTIVDGFYPQAWSPDGRRIAGLAFLPQSGLDVPATFSFEGNRVEPRPDLASMAQFGPTWLPDSRRVLGWDGLRNTAVLWDADSRVIQDIAGIPGPSEPRLSADGRTLVMNRTVLEGEVWLLTLK